MGAPKKNKKNTKIGGSRAAGIVGNILFYALICFILAVGVIISVCKTDGKNAGVDIFGYRYIVASDSSMASVSEKYAGFLEGHDDRIAYDPDKSYGDLVVAQPIPDDLELKIYDIVTFIYSDYVVIHRIVGTREDPVGTMYLTRGDSNDRDDGWRTRDEFTGILVATAGAGWSGLIMFMQSGYGIGAIAGILGVVLCSTLLISILDERARKRKAVVDEINAVENAMPVTEVSAADVERVDKKR